VFACAGKTDPPSRLIFWQTSAVKKVAGLRQTLRKPKYQIVFFIFWLRQHQGHRMRRFQNSAGQSAACAVSIFLILLASHDSALAQNVAALTGCELPVTQPTTDSAVTLSPQRGWQMVNREIELTVTSSKPMGDAKPLVCFRWKLKDGSGKFLPGDSLRIVQRTPANQQPSTLKLAVPVPDINGWPTTETGEYTETPVAEVRILRLDADDKALEDLLTTVTVVGAQDYCNVPGLGVGARTDSGTIVPSVSKNWQPVGGEIEFTAKTSKPIPNDALIRVCFRWKLTKGTDYIFSDSGPIRVLDRQPTMIKLAVQVPRIGDEQPGRFQGQRIGSYAIPYLLVPQADVRVLFFDADLNPVFDTRTKTGVTSVWIAVILVLLMVAVGFVALWQVCRRRFPTFGGNSPLLCLITTRRGFASLSQFQIMLWTFLVVASAVYVFLLSGDLIPITAGTLTLLGISGGVTVISKVKSESDATAAPPPLDPVTAAADAALAQDDARAARIAADLASGDAKAEAVLAAQEEEAKAEAATAKAEAADASLAAAKARAAVATAADKATAEAAAQAAEAQAEIKGKTAAVAAAKAAVLTRIRHPRWSDLVMEEIKGRELDVTRVQMLYFTLVTAVFVAVKVITSYEIPEIPEGFLILMGISNSVYVGSKLATNPAAK
jgi:hypothetical protein